MNQEHSKPKGKESTGLGNLNQLNSSEKGTGMLEYCFVALLIAVAVTAGIVFLGQDVSKKFTDSDMIDALNRN